MDAILRRLLRAAVRRGMAGDWTWLALALCLYILRRALRDDGGGVVSTLKLAPGEQVLISVRDHSTSALPDVTVVPLGESGHQSQSPSDAAS
jgi:hypothetical protein